MSYSCCSSAVHTSSPCVPDHGLMIVLYRGGNVFDVIKACASGTVPADLKSAYDGRFLKPAVEGQCYALCCEPPSSSP